MQKLKKESAGFRDLDIFEMSKYGKWRANLNFFLTFFRFSYNIVAIFIQKVRKTSLQQFFGAFYEKDLGVFYVTIFI